MHLLDDGLQHRGLARAVDIVLLERRDLTDWLLPAGRLREQRSSLHRVDICVLREEDRDWIAPVMDAMRTQDAARVWFQQRATIVPARLERAVAFCGLGNAEQFFSSLRQTGISPAAEVAFRDHHVYRKGDIDALVKHAQACRADGFVTTEKDSMRLQNELRRRWRRLLRCMWRSLRSRSRSWNGACGCWRPFWTNGPTCDDECLPNQKQNLRILIVRLGAMGDILHALPAVTALRAELPESWIGWAVEPQWSELLQAMAPAGDSGRGLQRPVVDRLHLVPAKRWARTPLRAAISGEIAAVRRALRAEQYDVCVDLQGAVRSAWIGRMAGAARMIGKRSRAKELPGGFFRNESRRRDGMLWSRREK